MGPKGDAVAAWAGNRTRASRVAGENSTTEPPMHRWPAPPVAAPQALAATRPSLLTARPWASLCPVAAGDDGRATCKTGSGHVQDPGARRSRREPGATGRGPTRPVPRLLRRPRPPRPSRCRVRAPGADAVCLAPGSLSGAGAEWSLRPRAIVPLSDRRVPTQSPPGGLAFRPCRGGACESGRGKGRRARSVREARARERGRPPSASAPAAPASHP